MKRTAFLLTIGVGLLALGLCGTWPANGQEPADALRLLQAENTLLKATMAQRDKEIESLKKEIESSKALTTTLLEKLRAKSGVATTPPVAGPTTPESATRPQAKQAAVLDKWAGFRGLKWGTNIADAPGMVQVKDVDWRLKVEPSDGDIKFYRREGDQLTIGAAEVKKIVYGFYKGRFYSVNIDVEGSSNWTALKEATFATYGEGEKPNEFSEGWYWGSSVATKKPTPVEASHYQPITELARQVAIAGASGSTPTPGVKDVGMSLECDEIRSGGMSRKEARLSMFYGPIKDEKKADEAKKAKKDF